MRRGRLPHLPKHPEGRRNVSNSWVGAGHFPSMLRPMATTTVVVETDLGNFEIELDEEKAPKSVANFLKYVDDKHYDGTLFHRVIPSFMAQGGGYDASLEKKPVREPVENEADNGLK